MDKPWTSKLWLKRERVTKGKTVSQIAKENSASPQTILNWLIKHGIEKKR